MKAISKILKIIIAFFFSMTIIALVWYVVEFATLEKNESLVPFIDFVLYLLGFGNMDSSNHYVQTVFSTLGLFSVTLLSSVFTVNLFELRSKVKISPVIVIRSKNHANIILNATGKDIYNLTATLIAKCGQDILTTEQVFPFVPKKSFQELDFDIEPGSVIYKYLRAIYLEDNNPQLILKVTYTDIESGQEYSMAQKYQYSIDKNQDIVFSDDMSGKHNELLERIVKESIEENTFDIDLSLVQPCEAEDIDIILGYKDDKTVLSPKDAFAANVHMNGSRVYTPDTFTMAVTKELLENDWTIYSDLGCVLKFDYYIDGDIAVTMELKYGVDNVIEHKQILRANKSFKTFKLSLQELNREELKSVRELCFTVFYKDVNCQNPVGSFVIKRCVLEVE